MWTTCGLLPQSIVLVGSPSCGCEGVRVSPRIVLERIVFEFLGGTGIIAVEILVIGVEVGDVVLDGFPVRENPLEVVVDFTGKVVVELVIEGGHELSLSV